MILIEKPTQRLLAILLVLGSVCSATVSAETVRLRADYWPPYNGDPDSDRPGYIVEIAREIFSNAGYDTDYDAIPWERAINEARRGHVDCIIGALPEEVPDFIFHQRPVGLDESKLYTRHNSDWQFDGEDSLRQIRLGVIGGYSYDQGILDSYIARSLSDEEPDGNVQVMKGNNALEKNLQKLVSGRIDVIVSSSAVLNYTLNELSMKGAVRDAGSIGTPDPLYIACSPATPLVSATYTRLLDEGLQRLRESGRLQQILSLYGLKDWADDI